MSPKFTKFVNCKLVRNHQLVDDYLWVLDGKIVDPEVQFYDFNRLPDEIVDLSGGIVCPGFIDIQINGGYGLDFSRDLISKPDGIRMVASKLIYHGVTSFCPTIVTSLPQTYHEVLKLIKPTKYGNFGAQVIGAHLEGPFISMEKHGAHEQTYIADLKEGVATIKEMYGDDLSNVKIVTLAPEKANSMEVIKWLSSKNIVTSLGHSEASIEVGIKAVENGARLITHLFNAMLPFHHRSPGLIGLLGANFEEQVFFGLIPDGIHAHAATLRIAHASNPKGIVLVTDAISAMGLKEGVHHIGDKEIEIKGNEACIAGTTTLCGSVITMDKCIKNFKKATNCSLVEAVEAASLHPAQVLGIQDKKGTLDFGSDADFVVIDEDITVMYTYIAGHRCYIHELVAIQVTRT